jgi:hypothetical protein
MTSLRSEYDSSKSEIESPRREADLLRATNATLEHRVSSLTTSLESYKSLRSRFISTFKRDKLHNAED